MHLSPRLKALVLTGTVTATAIGSLITGTGPVLAASAPPPSGGYFQLVPHGNFAALPSDSEAAAMVTRSAWEPRPDNHLANHTVAPSTFKTPGYSGMRNSALVFGRVTGNFTGTTDEIIQWAAAKWGLPDDILRADAVQESNWYQNRKTAQGAPISGQGYGDFGHCTVGSPPPAGYGSTGPASFGLLQAKWCALMDKGASNYGGWPYTEQSTAYAIDLYAAVIRGCFEGWDTWLRGTYAAGDLWGCLGRWYSGEWHSASGDNYVNAVKAKLAAKPWRSWTSADQPLATPPTGTTPNPTPSTRAGLAATYYNQLNFLGWSTTRVDQQVNFSWGAGTPSTAIWPDDFSARWTGQLTPEVSGYYRLATVSDDGVRLWLNGKRLVDNWTLHAATVNTAPAVHLTAGRAYPLRLEYYEKRGSAVLKLLWSPPAAAGPVPIPGKALSH